jgi:O-antigen/teichoic acid export membrane protein
MRRFEKIQLLKNVGSSWSGLALNVAVGIFLFPFIVHHLGDTAFGVWVLIFSITGYYGLFDMGIRSSIVRFVSKYTATKDTEKLARHISTCIFFYSMAGALTLLVTLVLMAFVNTLFRIPPALQTQALWLLLMVGISVALAFPLGVFGGMLDGMQRFYITNTTSILATLLRAALIVFFLRRGYGLFTVALITVAMPILTSILRGFIVFRLLPLTLSLKYVDWQSFRAIVNYSGATMIIILAGQLRFHTDQLVVGTMLSATAITYFTVGSRPVDYAQHVVGCLAQVFVPMSSQSEAVGNLDRVRKMYVAGNRACALVMFPLAAGLLILGKSVIEVWMGAKYVAASYPVTCLLGVPITLFFMQGASGRILLGMGKHRNFAIVCLLEGIANVVLSLILVRPLGIAGDALGTAIPMSLTALWFLPRHMKRQLGVPVRTFVHQAYTLPMLLTLPMAIEMYLVRSWSPAHHWPQLLLQFALGGALYGAGLLWAYRQGHVLQVAKSLAPSQPSLPPESEETVVAADYSNES